MLVFWEQRLVVLATPKTGSTAIYAALESLAVVSIQRPPALKHTNVGDFHTFLGPYLESAAGGPFTSVALMREPRDWLGSWYRHRKSDDIIEPEQRTSNLSFDDFVGGWCATPQPSFAAVGSQSEFLAPATGAHADRIFRYEQIDAFVEFLENRLDFQIVLPRLNVSPKAPLDLSHAMETVLRKTAAKDFQLYDSLP